MSTFSFDEKRALSMDDMMKESFNGQYYNCVFYAHDENEFMYLITTAKILKEKGLLDFEFLCEGCLETTLNEKGQIFIQYDGFMKQLEAENESKRLAKLKLEHEETAHQVNKKALAAAKREPWLIAWTVISTLAALYLTYLQYIKS